MPTESDVLSAAQRVCHDDGRGVRVVDVILVGTGFAVNISFPKAPGMSDATWWAIIQDVRDKLSGIPGVDRVLVDMTP